MNVEAMLEMMCLFLSHIGSQILERAIRISTLLTGKAGVILSVYHGALTKKGFYRAEQQWRYDHWSLSFFIFYCQNMTAFCVLVYFRLFPCTCVY
jgi:hypothetical protein